MVTRRRALARTRPPPAGANQSLTSWAPPLPWPAPPPNGAGPHPAGLDPAPCLPDPPPVGRAHPAPLNAKTGPGSSAFCRWNPASWASKPHPRWAPAEAAGVWREVSGSTRCPQAERDLLRLRRACRPPPQKTHQVLGPLTQPPRKLPKPTLGAVYKNSECFSRAPLLQLWSLSSVSTGYVSHCQIPDHKSP
ncbi:CASP-like protein 4A1 isoform X1 [Ailuropoda melanoleuca]|uniref:CASP-like protein 4A1 isoform X1 n=1 Tax=Ailuropoda melanoleuca TaxID=9646 RepID=UPI001494A630|nr:CASP-like protein 4A1 isoform X1 [Ailuropoda melanoleuca]